MITASSPNPSHRFRFAASVQAWTWAAVVISLAVCLAIYRLHCHQEDIVRHSQQLLTNLREARLDLARGFLHLSLADDPRSPFRREEGIALLDQSITALEEAKTQINAATTSEPQDTELGQTFQARIHAFREQLADYHRADASRRPNLQLPLRLSFHELERLTLGVDHVGQDSLRALANRLDAQLTTTLIAAAVLLSLMCVGVYQMGRRERTAERALQESERRRTEAQRIARIGNWEWNLRTGQVRWSEEIYAMSGMTPDSAPLTLDTLLKLVHPEDAEQVRAAITRAVSEGTPTDLDYRIILADGSVRTIHMVGAVMEFDAEGLPALMVGTNQDITERKQAEEGVRDRETQLQTLGDNIPGGAIYQLLSPPDGRNRYTYFSAGIESIFGISASSVLADPAPFWELIVEEDRPAIDAVQARSLRDLTVFDCEFRQRTLAGEIKWLHAISKPRRLTDGSTIWDGVVMDITERKQAEAALERTNNTLVEAQRIAHLGSFEYVAATQTTMWSDEEYRIYGLDSTGPSPTYDEMLARCIHPDDAALLHETFVKAMQSQSVYELEHRVVRPDGSVRWVYDLARPYLDARGNLVRYVGTTLDITERKQSEQALRESESRRGLALDAAQAGTWEWDLTTGRNIWSDELWTLYALEPHSCEPSYGVWRKTVHPEDRERAEQELRAIVQEEAELNLEWRVDNSGDGTRWLLSRGRPLRDASGRVIRYLGVVMDITRLKLAEASLRESERFAREQAEELQTLMDLAPVSIWVAQDPECRRITGNPAARALFDAVPDENLSAGPATGGERNTTRRFFQQGRELAPEDLPLQQAARTNSEVHASEITIANPNGKTVTILGSARPLRDDAGLVRGCIGFFMDITERKRLEQERAAMEAQLRQQQKLESIGTLASGVAHEINNPITGILNYAQLIQDELPGDSPLAEFTGEIMHETQRVATIVRSLLTFARDEKQSHSPARMADIVEAVLALVRTLIRRDEITLQVTMPPDLPELKCRSQQIQQVIMNLVTNARDALNERYPGYHADKVLNLEARLLDRAGRRWIRLTVEDHGTGIPPEVRERMFDPFFTTKRRDKGTGLGLSISHGIVEDHHGVWTVESEPGRFTRMHVDLPVDNGWEL